ncbi:hypothetical protein [Mycobacterium syngnathidarum]
MSLRIAAVWFLRGIDIVFVAAVAYPCSTLVWCDGPFERMGWIFPAFLVGAPLLLAGGVYFGECGARGRRVVAPVAAIPAVIALSMLLIGTNLLRKARWAHARPEVLAIPDHPPTCGETQHRWIGTYPATVHTNTTGTVLSSSRTAGTACSMCPPGCPIPTETATCGSAPRCCRAGGTTTLTDPPPPSGMKLPPT